MSRFSFSRHSIISFLAILGFLLGLGLPLITSEHIVLLPISLQGEIVRLPSAFGPDMSFLIGYFVCFGAADGILGFTSSRKEKHGTKQRTNRCQPPPFTSRRSFTLIELLIVIAVIAVLATVVILALNPAELLRQARDANRVSDMRTLEQALNLYSEDVGGDMGTSSVVYVSVPDPTATTAAGSNCSGIGFSSSSLPTGWTYHCAGPNYYKNVDGTGWIPADFKVASFGTPLGTLPVDPTNTTSSGLYYSYVANGDSWEFTADMESQKYGMGGSNDVVTKDGGQYPDLYEVGTDLSLAPVDYGPSLVGYWKLDEGPGTVAYDSSGHGNDGTWSGTEAGTSGYYSAGHNQTWAGTFDGSTDYVNTGKNGFSFGDSPRSVFAWVYLSNASSGAYWVHSYGANLGGEESGLEIISSRLTFNGAGGVDFYSSFYPPAYTWHFVGYTYGGGNTVTIYYDGQSAVGTFSGGALNTASSGSSDIGLLNTGIQRWQGLIQDLRIYNCALSASESQAIYNSEK